MSKKTTTKTTTTATTTKDKNAKGGARKPGATDKADFGYDASKDVVVKELGTIETGTRAGDIVVRVVSYDGGAKKVLVARTGVSKKTGQAWFTPKLGRLTGEELDALLPLLAKARKLVD